MSNIADRVAAAFEALQGRIAELENKIARLRQENDGLKNRVQILEGLLNGQIPPFALERIAACLGYKP